MAAQHVCISIHHVAPLLSKLLRLIQFAFKQRDGHCSAGCKCVPLWVYERGVGWAFDGRPRRRE